MRLKRIIPDQLIGVLATGFFLFISLTGSWGLTGVLERITFDLGVRLAADEAQNPDIEIVAVTEEDLEELGRPPWPREVLARAVLNLAGAGAKVIAINMPFTEPEESKGLETVKSLKDKFESMGLAQDGPGLEFYKELTDAAKDLDSDRILAEAVREAGNVVLPVQFHSDGRGRDSVPPPFIEANALRGIRGAEDDWALDSVVHANKVKPLLPLFAEAAAGIGHSNVFPDPDGVVREQVPAVGYLGRLLFPSFPMAIVKAFKALRDEDVAEILGEGVQARANLSERVFMPARTDRTAALIKWSKGPDRTFRWTPFMTVFKNRIRTPLFRDKIVILGATAPELDGTYNTPINPRLPGVEVVANSTANILEGEYYSRPPWIAPAELGLILLIGAYLTLVLPRLGSGGAAVFTLGILVVCAAGGGLALYTHDIWMQVTTPILLLVTGYMLLVFKRRLTADRDEERGVDAPAAEEPSGYPYQSQDRLDLALEKFNSTKIFVEDEKDLKHPKENAPKSILGRYQVAEELGRGVKGVVYKGEDIKGQRQVAVKAISLTGFDDEPEEVIEAGLLREVESAAFLTHPNIAAVYDMGIENGLAYIVTEYLEAEDLEDSIKRMSPLPVRDAVSIGGQVADALSYAHSKGMIHRGIKPTNILRLKGGGKVKVTDFGMARGPFSMRLKTGMFPGALSYMSPEQVAGKKVDPRSDIFSLGVVLYELLTGRKPFQGDDMASLMHAIDKKPHEPLKTLNPKIPKAVEQIVDRALQKDTDKRYPNADLIAGHLKKVAARLERIRSGGF